MKNIRLFLFAALAAALPLRAQNIAILKTQHAATPADTLVDASKIIVVPSGGSITASGSGVIAATTAASTPAGALTGTTLASNVINSSLTSVGTISSGTWQGTPIANAYLANPSLTLGTTALTLGTTTTSLAGLGTLGWTNGTNDLVARTITPAAGNGLFREYIATGADATDTPIYIHSYNSAPNSHQDVGKAGWVFQIEPNYLGQSELIWAVNSVAATAGVPNLSTRYLMLTGNQDGSGGVAHFPDTVYMDKWSSGAVTRSFVFNAGAGTIDFGGSAQISNAVTVNGGLATNSSFTAQTTIKAGTAIGAGTLPLTIPSDAQLYVYGNSVAGVARIDASGTNSSNLILAKAGVDKWTFYNDGSNNLKIGRSGIADDLSVSTGSGNVSVLGTSVSSSTTTGALIVNGGVGIAGAMNVGSTVAVNAGTSLPQFKSTQATRGDNLYFSTIALANQSDGTGGNGAARGPFNVNVADISFSGAGLTYFDPAMAIGLNVDIGGGNVIDAQPRFNLTIEGDYWDGTRHNVEAYFEWRDGSGVSPRKQLRPIFWQFDRSNGHMTNMSLATSGFGLIDWLGASDGNGDQYVFAGWTLTGITLNGTPTQSTKTLLDIVAQNGKAPEIDLEGTVVAKILGSNAGLNLVSSAVPSQPVTIYATNSGGTAIAGLTVNAGSATFAGSVAVAGAITGATSMTMNGALSGVTTATLTGTTGSTAPSQGTLLLSGTGAGLGVNGNIWAGGVVGAGNGTEAAPGFTFTGDSGLGIYGGPSNNYVAIAVGGTRRFIFDGNSIISGASGGGSVALPSSGTITLNASSGQTIVSQINAVNVATQSSTVLNIVPSTASASTTTGSLVNAGGFGNAGDFHNGGNALIDTAGKTLSVKSGANAAAGTVTLVAGAATITSTAIDANTVILFSEKTAGGTPGVYQPLAAVSSGSAAVTSAATDTSTYNWVAMKVN